MNTAYCARCWREATGTAMYNCDDGLRYPACADHGLTGTYVPNSGYVETLLERIDTLTDALASAYKDVAAWRERATEAEVRLRYIRRVRAMQPSAAALAMLDEQEAELMKGNTD